MSSPLISTLSFLFISYSWIPLTARKEIRRARIAYVSTIAGNSIAKEIIAQAHAQADSIIGEAKAQAEKDARKIVAQAEARAEDSVKRLASSSDMRKRKAVLEAKQEVISEVLEDAYKAVGELDDAAYFPYTLEAYVFCLSL